MSIISDFLYSRTRLYLCISATFIMGVYAALVMGGQSQCFQEQLDEGIKVFGLTFGLNMEYALSFFQSLNLDGLLCYKRLMLIWDNIFPVIYCSMYLLWLSYFLRGLLPKSTNLRLINIYPIIPALLDWLENITEVKMVNYYIENADLLNATVNLNSLISQVKWIASYMNYLILLTALLIFVFNKLKSRNKSWTWLLKSFSIIISALMVLMFAFFFVYLKQLIAWVLLITPYMAWLVIATSLNAYILINN